MCDRRDTLRQEVKSPRPHSKKLFEWDRSQRILRLKINQREYLCELAEDNTFVCIAENDRDRTNLKSTEQSAELLDGW